MKNILAYASRNRLLLISFLLITLMSSQAQLGFLMLLVAPFSVIYQLIRLAFRWKDRQLRKDHLVSLAVVAISVLVVALSHIYRYKAARSIADVVVAEITSFKKTNGRYPSNGKELGLSDKLRERPYSLTYYNVEGRPRLYYVATFGPFDRYTYNFSDGVWEYQPD